MLTTTLLPPSCDCLPHTQHAQQPSLTSPTLTDLILIINTTDSYGHVRMHVHFHLVFKELNGIANVTATYTGIRGHTKLHLSHRDQGTHNTYLTLGPEDTHHIPYTGTRGHTTYPSHWDQRTHNTSLTLGPEDTQHIPHTGTRGHTTHPLHWDQRTHNISLTLGPEDTQHIPHTGTRRHTTHPTHWDQRTHNTSLTLGPEDTQHIPHTGTRGHTTHSSHWDQGTHNTSLTLGPEDTQHIPYTGTRGHTTHPLHWDTTQPILLTQKEQSASLQLNRCDLLDSKIAHTYTRETSSQHTCCNGCVQNSNKQMMMMDTCTNAKGQPQQNGHTLRELTTQHHLVDYFAIPQSLMTTGFEVSPSSDPTASNFLTTSIPSTTFPSNLYLKTKPNKFISKCLSSPPVHHIPSLHT